MRAIRSEVLKLVSLRSTWLLLGGMLVVEGLFAVLFAGAPEKDKIDQPLNVLGGSSVQTVIVFCVGALLSTNEFRYGTANSTFLLTPRRETVLGAKLLVGFVAGLVAALLFVAVNAGFGLAILSNRGIDVDGQDALNVYLGTGIGMVLTCLFGVGLGALLRSQPGAITAGLVVFFVLRGISALIGDPGEYLPGQALLGLQGSITDDVLDQVPGGLVFFAYTVIFAVAGAVGLRSKEIA